MRGGMVDVDQVFHVGPVRQERIDRHARRQVQPPVLEIAYARGKAIAEEGKQAKTMVRDAPRVDRMLVDLEARLVVEQAIEHMRRLTGGGGDHFSVERAVL